MTVDDLKACPFCGSQEASLIWRGTRFGRITYVSCGLCGSQTKAFSYMDEKDGVNEEDAGAQQAMRAWNRRPNE